MQIYQLPKQYEVYLNLLNQVFEIEKKLEKIADPNTIGRNLMRLKEMIETDLPFSETAGFSIENPINQKYEATRTDCDASIAGELTENLIITEVIRPIIRFKQGGVSQIVQKGVVVVQAQK